MEMKIGFYSFHVNLALHDVVWIALGAGVQDGMFKVIDSVILANLLSPEHARCVVSTILRVFVPFVFVGLFFGWLLLDLWILVGTA